MDYHTKRAQMDKQLERKTNMTQQQPLEVVTDFYVMNNGYIIIFTPDTKRAADWLNSNVQSESWQWLGNALCVEHRYADGLIELIKENGFIINNDL